MEKMDELMEFLKAVSEFFQLWHKKQFRRLRDAVCVAALIAVIFILPGAFLGALSWTLKVVWLEIGMAAIIVTVLSLAYYRIPIGLEISALLESDFSLRPRNVARAVVRGAEDYIRLVAGILTSVLAAGLIALWLPAHRNPVMAVMVLFAAITLVTYGVWRKGGVSWPKIVYRLALFTLVMSVVMVFFPQTSTKIGKAVMSLDDKTEASAALQSQCFTPNQLPLEVHIPLLGEGVVSSEGVNIDRYSENYSGWRYIFEGPDNAKAHFNDGTEDFIKNFPNFPVKGGTVRFSGPAGQEVVVRFTPPYKKEA